MDDMPTWARWMLYPHTCPWAPLRWLLTVLDWCWSVIAYWRWSPIRIIGLPLVWIVEHAADAEDRLNRWMRR